MNTVSALQEKVERLRQHIAALEKQLERYETDEESPLLVGLSPQLRRVAQLLWKYKGRPVNNERLLIAMSTDGDASEHSIADLRLVILKLKIAFSQHGYRAAAIRLFGYVLVDMEGHQE